MILSNQQALMLFIIALVSLKIRDTIGFEHNDRWELVNQILAQQSTEAKELLDTSMDKKDGNSQESST
jgi:hypothetical protein